jgi:hypothetical protein
MRRFFPVAVLGLVLALSSSCINPACFWNPDVNFIFPDGYVGVFRLVLDEGQGLDVTLKGGRYVYEIPKNGILVVKSFEPLSQCHSEYAQYDSGAKIPTFGSDVNPETIALRGGLVESKGYEPLTFIKLIGTKNDWDKFLEER